MKREIYKDLVNWKASSKRKPLMLYGARQVGKTYILKQFGTQEFENIVYINCYKNPAMETLFKEDVNISRILLGLSAISGEEIFPQRTLIFLDEVQEIPEVVASLKYFCEDAPEICIATAGSLLGVMDLKECSFPTGKVDILHMFPMNFLEFLEGTGNEKLAEPIRNRQWDIVNAVLPNLTDLLRQFYFVGGMPEAVVEYKDTKSLVGVRKIQLELLDAYEADIAKHAGSDAPKARLVFESIPSQLARENKKFIFGAVKKGGRAAEFDNAIQWLTDAGLVYKIKRVKKVASPLKFYYEQDVFKLYILDVGLLGAMAQVAASQILIGDNIFSEYKGAFTENYVLTQMMASMSTPIAYYSKDNSTVEIDFVVQTEFGEIIPIEVKAEENVKSKSLRQFVTIDNAGKNMHGIRYSMRGYKPQDWMTNIPLSAAGIL